MLLLLLLASASTAHANTQTWVPPQANPENELAIPMPDYRAYDAFLGGMEDINAQAIHHGHNSRVIIQEMAAAWPKFRTAHARATAGAQFVGNKLHELGKIEAGVMLIPKLAEGFAKVASGGLGGTLTIGGAQTPYTPPQTAQPVQQQAANTGEWSTGAKVGAGVAGVSTVGALVLGGIAVRNRNRPRPDSQLRLHRTDIEQYRDPETSGMYNLPIATLARAAKAAAGLTA